MISDENMLTLFFIFFLFVHLSIIFLQIKKNKRFFFLDVIVVATKKELFFRGSCFFSELCIALNQLSFIFFLSSGILHAFVVHFKQPFNTLFQDFYDQKGEDTSPSLFLMLSIFTGEKYDSVQLDIREFFPFFSFSCSIFFFSL